MHAFLVALCSFVVAVSCCSCRIMRVACMRIYGVTTSLLNVSVPLLLCRHADLPELLHSRDDARGQRGQEPTAGQLDAV